MTIVVLGGAGFVGANLAIHLALTTGQKIIAVDNLVRRGSELNLPRLKGHGVQFIHADIRNREDMVPVFQSGHIDWFCDCAAQPSAIGGYANPRFDFTNNTFSLINILEHCRQTGSGIIFWSTNKVYPKEHVAHIMDPREGESRFDSSYAIDENCPLDGKERSLYGVSKIMADLMIQEWSDSFGFPAYINRFSCIGGPWQWGKTEQGWLAWWVIAHELGIPLTYYGFGGKQVRDILDIHDLCRLVEYQIRKSGSGPRVYNVGGGPNNTISLIECTKACQEITGHTSPISIAEERRADFNTYISNINKVYDEVGWTPTVSVRTTLENIYDWMRLNRQAIEGMYL